MTEMIRFMECWRLDCILARLDEWEYILMSSANCDRKVFGLVGVGISVTCSKKRIGLRESCREVHRSLILSSVTQGLEFGSTCSVVR